MTEQEQQVHEVVQAVAKETQVSARLDSYMHALIVMTVLISASLLRVANELDTPTLSTVYGAALGYATGLTMKRSL